MWGSREASSAIRLVPRLVCVCIILTTYFGWGKLTAKSLQRDEEEGAVVAAAQDVINGLVADIKLRVA